MRDIYFHTKVSVLITQAVASKTGIRFMRFKTMTGRFVYILILSFQNFWSFNLLFRRLDSTKQMIFL